MAIRKGNKLNIKASLSVTKKNSIFIDLKPEEVHRVRFLPPNDPSGSLFTKVENHFGFVAEDDPNRKTNYGCLQHFRDEPCYLCKLSKVLKREGDKAEKQIGDDIRPSPNFYAQVLQAEKGEDGELIYSGPKLLRLPKTGVDQVNEILLAQDESGDDLLADIANGQDVTVRRTGTGKHGTKYFVLSTGQKNNLDTIFPEWEEKYIEDMMEEIGIKVISYEEQKEAAMRTFGDDLPWEELEEEYGL